jgi:hypothetical protein
LPEEELQDAQNGYHENGDSENPDQSLIGNYEYQHAN